MKHGQVGEPDERFSSALLLPSSQFAGSSGSSETGLSFARKNGRKIRYAFESITSGNTFKVPCVGAVSLQCRIHQ